MSQRRVMVTGKLFETRKCLEWPFSIFLVPEFCINNPKFQRTKREENGIMLNNKHIQDTQGDFLMST